jgi:hypothetical protein
VGGLALEFHRRISKYYGRLERLDLCVKERIKDPDVWRFESRVAEQIIKEWLAEFPEITVIKVVLLNYINSISVLLNFPRGRLILRVQLFVMSSESLD